ncbi:MAG: DUF4294 domain-containing protein [Saprospiraceae bacterium]|nr:DUF4294 domain-containing protein [Saprospiraceae bacterium]
MKQHLLQNRSLSWVTLVALLAFSSPALAQVTFTTNTDTTQQLGAWARMEIVNGDTTFVMSLRPVRITARWKFSDLQQQRQYYLYIRAAKKVYPYALQAVGLYEEIQDQTDEMNKRQRRRYIRHEHKELKDDMKDQLTNLTKTEGRVLIKMIEKQLHKPFYTIVRETRGGATATYWHQLGKIWGYDLKEGYIPGADPLLDAVFIDYDFGDPLSQY